MRLKMAPKMRSLFTSFFSASLADAWDIHLSAGRFLLNASFMAVTTASTLLTVREVSSAPLARTYMAVTAGTNRDSVSLRQFSRWRARSAEWSGKKEQSTRQIR